MNDYYNLNFKEQSDVAIAYTEIETLLPHEIISDIKNLELFPYKMFLKNSYLDRFGEFQTNFNLTNIKPLWLDLIPNNLGWYIISEKMKFVISNNIKGAEYIDFIRVDIYSEDDCRDYYIIKFNKSLDVLDKSKTIYVKNTAKIIRPVFDFLKIKDLNIFNIGDRTDWEIPHGIYVNSLMRKTLIKEKLLGVTFEKISSSRISNR